MMKNEEKFRLHKFDIDRTKHKWFLYFLIFLILITIKPVYVRLPFSNNNSQYEPLSIMQITSVIFIICLSLYIYRSIWPVRKLYIGKLGIEIYPENYKLLFSDIKSVRVKEKNLNRAKNIYLKTKKPRYKIIPLLISWIGYKLTINVVGADHLKLYKLLLDEIESR